MWSWKFNSPVKFSELKRESGEITRLPLKDRKLIIVRFQTTQRAQININLMGVYIYIHRYMHPYIYLFHLLLLILNQQIIFSTQLQEMKYILFLQKREYFCLILSFALRN